VTQLEAALRLALFHVEMRDLARHLGGQEREGRAPRRERPELGAGEDDDGEVSVLRLLPAVRHELDGLL
jgi:hypothetical protein